MCFELQFVQMRPSRRTDWPTDWVTDRANDRQSDLFSMCHWCNCSQCLSDAIALTVSVYSALYHCRTVSLLSLTSFSHGHWHFSNALIVPLVLHCLMVSWAHCSHCPSCSHLYRWFNHSGNHCLTDGAARAFSLSQCLSMWSLDRCFTVSLMSLLSQLQWCSCSHFLNVFYTVSVSQCFTALTEFMFSLVLTLLPLSHCITVAALVSLSSSCHWHCSRPLTNC